LQQSPRYRVLIAKVPPMPQTEGAKLRSELVKNSIPVFKAEIPRLKSFDTASSRGLLVSALRDSAARRGWEAYEKAGREILSGK
jgi:chromosome partitioning protein